MAQGLTASVTFSSSPMIALFGPYSSKGSRFIFFAFLFSLQFDSLNPDLLPHFHSHSSRRFLRFLHVSLSIAVFHAPLSPLHLSLLSLYLSCSAVLVICSCSSFQVSLPPFSCNSVINSLPPFSSLCSLSGVFIDQ